MPETVIVSTLGASETEEPLFEAGYLVKQNNVHKGKQQKIVFG